MSAYLDWLAAQQIYPDLDTALANPSLGPNRGSPSLPQGREWNPAQQAENAAWGLGSPQPRPQTADEKWAKWLHDDRVTDPMLNALSQLRNQYSDPGLRLPNPQGPSWQANIASGNYPGGANSQVPVMGTFSVSGPGEGLLPAPGVRLDQLGTWQNRPQTQAGWAGPGDVMNMAQGPAAESNMQPSWGWTQGAAPRGGRPSATPQQIAASDAAWEARQQAWDQQEAARNAREDAAIAAAQNRPPSNYDYRGLHNLMKASYQPQQRPQQPPTTPQTPTLPQVSGWSATPETAQYLPSGTQTSIYNLMQNQPGIAAILRLLMGQ